VGEKTEREAEGATTRNAEEDWVLVMRARRWGPGGEEEGRGERMREGPGGGGVKGEEKILRKRKGARFKKTFLFFGFLQ